MNEYALHVLSDGGKKQDVSMCPQFYHEQSGNLDIGLRTFHSVDAVAWKKVRTGIEYRLKRKASPPKVIPNLSNEKDRRTLEAYARHIHGRPSFEDLHHETTYNAATGVLKQWGKVFKMSDALEWAHKGKPGKKSVAITKKIAKDILVEYIMRKHGGMFVVNKSAAALRKEAVFRNPFGSKTLFPTSIQYRNINATIGQAIEYLKYDDINYYYVIKDSEQRMFVILYEGLKNRGNALLPAGVNHKTYDAKTGTLTTYKGTYTIQEAIKFLSNDQHIEFRLEHNPSSKPASPHKVASPPKPSSSKPSSPPKVASPSKPSSSRQSPKPSSSPSKGMVCTKLVDGRAGEDRIKTLKVGNVAIYAIFDGHGAGYKFGKGKHGAGVSDVADYLVDHFDRFKQLVTPSFPTTKAVLKTRADLVFKSLDDEMKALNLQHGATATICIHDESNGNTFFIHLADSRAIWKDDSGKVGETKDHSPNNILEATRIKNNDGFVYMGRVGGSLAVSRAFGDFFYKQPLNNAKGDWVSAVPEVTGDVNNPIKISKPGSYILIASDGLWTYADNNLVRKSELNCNAIERLVAEQNIYGRDDFSLILLKK